MLRITEGSRRHMLSVDVIVPVHGKWELTASCLRHLRGQTMPHRVILVDDKSPDDTLDRVSADFPEVDVIALETNRGFAGACNEGIAAGDGEVVILLNNDVEASPTLVEALVRPLREQPVVGSTAAVLLRPDGRVDSIGVCADKTLAGFSRGYGARIVEAAPSDATIPELLGPCGAAAAYRRTALESVGGFDESFLMYGEDLELALRLRSAGWGCVAAPDARGVHLGGATTQNGSPRQRYMAGYGRGYILRRYNVLASRQGARAILTEAAVCAAGVVLFRDTAESRGRLDGWRAARDASKRQPPRAGLDRRIGFARSLLMRRPDHAPSEAVALAPTGGS
jgi:GT2 family glycosyltransferase